MLFRLMRDEDRERLNELSGYDLALQFPTVVAEEDGEIAGFISTRVDDRIYAERFIMRPGRSMSALAMVEMYEATLRRCGVLKYNFSVAHDEERWIDMLGRLPMVTEWHRDLDASHFERLISHA